MKSVGKCVILMVKIIISGRYKSVNTVLDEFLEQEVTDVTYEDLFNFISSRHLCRGTFECRNHVVMKVSSSQLITYSAHTF